MVRIEHTISVAVVSTATYAVIDASLELIGAIGTIGPKDLIPRIQLISCDVVLLSELVAIIA